MPRDILQYDYYSGIARIILQLETVSGGGYALFLRLYPYYRVNLAPSHSDCSVSVCQGLSSPRWQQLASRPLSLSAGLRGPEAPPAGADVTFKVTMVPGDGVGPELMTAVKDVFKVNFD